MCHLKCKKNNQISAKNNSNRNAKRGLSLIIYVNQTVDMEETILFIFVFQKYFFKIKSIYFYVLGLKINFKK